MSSDMKRMELLSMDFGSLVERCLLAETMWNESVIERDKLRAENERLKMALREIIDTSSKYKLENDDDNSNNYWEWDDNALDLLIEIDKIVEQALNEVTK